MTANILPKIIEIRELAREYYALPKGALISKPEELFRIFDVKSIKHDKHPHETYRVYVSRKALKHFVEERKAELSKKHEEANVLLKICFAIEQIPEVIINFDRYEYEHDPEKHFYTKHYSGEPSIRVLCEISEQPNGLEVCSIHFTKSKKES